MEQTEPTTSNYPLNKYRHPLLHNDNNHTPILVGQSSKYSNKYNNNNASNAVDHMLNTSHVLARPQFISSNDTLNMSHLYQSPIKQPINQNNTRSSTTHNNSNVSYTNNNSTPPIGIHSPVQANLSTLVRDKERELHELNQYKQSLQQHNNTNINNNTAALFNNTILDSTQHPLNTTVRASTDPLYSALNDLRYELKQKNLHINELERRIEQLHELIANKDSDTIKFVEDKQLMLNKYDKRVDKLNRAHAVELQQLREQFELAQQSMYDELEQRQRSEHEKTIELQQMLQSSETAFTERKRAFAEKESMLQHQIATYATHALNHEREINMLKQQNNSLMHENHELKSIARSYENTLNDTQLQLHHDQVDHNTLVNELQSQINELKLQQQITLANYEQQTQRLITQLHNVQDEIRSINDRHAAELDNAIQSNNQQHAVRQSEIDQEHSNAIRQLQTELEQIQQQLNSIQDDKNQLLSKYDTLINQHKQLSDDHGHTVDTLNTRIHDIELRYTDSMDKIEQLNRKLSERETELGQHFVELQQCKSREKELNKKLNDQRDQHKQSTDTLTNSYNTKLHDINERVRRLEREVNDKTLSLQAEQNRTSELTALVTTLRNVTSETARIKTIEQQQLLNEYNGNLNNVKNEINKISISPRNVSVSSPNNINANNTGTKQVKLRTIALSELENIQHNQNSPVPPTPKLNNLVPVPLTSRQ